MARGVLNQAEVDALMELFGTAPKSEQKPQHAEKPSPEVGALRSELEATARRWEAALAALTGAPVTVTLQSIVRRGRAAEEADAILLMCAERGRYLIVPEPLVNLVNEKSLGALEPDPLLGHPLSTIDKALFESTGALFAEGKGLAGLDRLPGGEKVLEARFDIAVAPLLKTTVRLLLDEESF
ncbi:hypothetical protein [Sulfurimonas diazotrophicus]|uniref:Uncharacterized protein n=1 Tax=Sulfurimonas diazotrophicus TaxID=3131939 RepID=A0ABZ3HDA6_9BACT